MRKPFLIKKALRRLDFGRVITQCYNRVRKPCLIKKALRLIVSLILCGNKWRPLWENLAWLRRHYDLPSSVTSTLVGSMNSVRKPCLIKKALRLPPPKSGDFGGVPSPVRKPCLIKKALRRRKQFFGNFFGLATWWENLAWLRRHYDDFEYCCVWEINIRMWENLAWLRRHYDLNLPSCQSSKSFLTPVRKPCLIKKALRPLRLAMKDVDNCPVSEKTLPD